MSEQKEKLYTKADVQKLDNSEVEIEIHVSNEVMDEFRTRALNKLRKDANIPGFRPGKVPDNILLEKVGEQGLLQEAAELAIQETYPLAVMDNNLQTVGQPQISVTKIAPGNPLEFKAKTAVVPEITLADYTKIAKNEMAKKEDVSVNDKEVEDVLMDIRRVRTRAQKELAPDAEVKDEDLLELNDEFVAGLGGFKSVDEFKKQVRENMGKEKEIKNREKKRIAISEELIKKSKIEVPQILIDSEIQKMTAQFQEDVMRMGVTYEDYLQKIGKTEEQLKEEWKEVAEKRAKLQLIVNKISIEEHIVPDKDEVTKQVDHLKEHYKEADPERIQIYVETMMTNDLVFEFLESQGKTSKKDKSED